MARRYLVLVLLVPLAATAADLKITRVTHYNRVMQNRTDSKKFPDKDWERTETVYVHGGMHRFEFSDKPAHTDALSGLSHAAVIDNCETRESMTIDLDAGEYTIAHMPPEASMRAALEEGIRTENAERLKNQSSAEERSKLKVIIETKTVDTGETMPFLGYIAHHFVTTSHEIPVGELAVLIDRHEDITDDVWYIDAPLRLPNRYCIPDVSGSSAAHEAQLLQRQEATQQVKHTGPTPNGLLVKSKRVATISARTDAYTETLETTVTELSQAPLDASLFTPPSDYRPVKCLRGQPCGEK